MLVNYLAAVCCMFVIFVGDPKYYMINGWLLCIANVGFGLCVVFYNA